MSGIAGIIHFDGKPVEPGLLEKMTGAMAHRGPDGTHHWVKGSVARGLRKPRRSRWNRVWMMRIGRGRIENDRPLVDFTPFDTAHWSLP